MGITKLITSKNNNSNFDITLNEVLTKMLKYKSKYLVLIKDNKAIGIITERDILFLFSKHVDFNQKAMDFAKKELINSQKNRKLDYILGLMINYNIRRVIINDKEGNYIGVILQEDIIYQFEQDVYKSHIKLKEIIKESNKALYVNNTNTLQDAMDLMTKKNIGSILIYENNKPIGILTETDIISLASKNVNVNVSIKEYMQSPILSFKTDDYLYEVVSILRNKNIRRAVISDEDNKNFYVITSKDILNNIKGSYSLFLESKLRDVKKTFNSLNEAIIEVFDNGEEKEVIYWFNKKAKKLFNIKVDDNITSILPKKRWQDLYKKVKKINIINDEIFEYKDNIYQITLLYTKILGNTIVKLLFTNITELVKANKEIEEKYNETFEQESIGILHVSSSNKILNANSKICKLLQYTKEELLNKDILELTYYDDIEKTLENLNNLILQKDLNYFSLEKRYIRKDSTILWVNVTNSISKDEEGNIKYFICFIMDISKQINLKEQLFDSNNNKKNLYENIPFAYQKLSKDGKLTEVNDKWLELTSYKKEEVLGKEFFDFVIENKESYREKIQELLEDGQINNYMGHIIKKNGTLIPCSFNARCVEENEEIVIHCIFKDESKKEKLQKQLNLANIVYENTTEGIMICNEKNKIISVNSAFSKITQYPLNEILGRNPKFLKSGKHNSTFYKNMWKEIEQNDCYKGEIWNRKKNGEIYAEWINISVVRNNKGSIINYVTLFSDITKMKNSAKKIEYLAHHDPLTNLPNKLLLNARLDKALEKAQEEHSNIAVLFIDIDNFKYINDTYGHSIGDKIINLVAKRLEKIIKKSDTIARIGGDEFIIVLEDINSKNDIEQITSKIIRNFDEALKLQEYLFETTVSIGVSMYPNNGLNAEDLIKHADTAMYSAKNAGKNQFHFYDNQMTSDIFERIIMKQEIKDALANNEFEVYYQPQIAIKTNKIIGAEALVRWNHKVLGLVSPDSFIPHAESTKLIVPLGEKILENACIFMKKLQEDKILENGKISVNISGIQIKNSDIIATVLNILNKTNLDSNSLELEVTETYIMEDINETLEMFKKLKKIGISLAIDDFGTGYSSLAYLKQFPIDKLKIDKSFVDELPHNSKDVAIAKTVISLAKGLNLKTIAEGVETKEQKDFLKEELCDEIQGWYYSKALNEKDFINFVKNHKEA